MENFDFSETEREQDVNETRNKIPGTLERRVDLFAQDRVPETEIKKLLQDLQGRKI